MKHFQLKEFDCNCGCALKGKAMDPDFLIGLDDTRDRMEFPMIITSGLRCAKHNGASGGSLASSHLKGMAADIYCSDSTFRFLLVIALEAEGFNRIGIGKDFVHVDNDPLKPPNRMWLY